MTLIEAPTGSGKTEAALAYASRLLAAGLAESVIFALPTQATANAMLTRLEQVAGILFPGAANVSLPTARRATIRISMRSNGKRKTRPRKARNQLQCIVPNGWRKASSVYS